MKVAELIFVALALVALILNLFLIPGGGVMTVIILSTLSMLYFYLGFALFNNIRLRNMFKTESYKGIKTIRIVGAIGTGIALSITIVGLMFKFMSWPGAMINIMVGLTALTVITIISLVKFLQNKSAYYTKILSRIAIFGGIALTLVLLPKYSLLEFKYGDYPDYVDAVKKSAEDPGNKELQYRVLNEREKMFKQR